MKKQIDSLIEKKRKEFSLILFLAILSLFLGNLSKCSAQYKEIKLIEVDTLYKNGFIKSVKKSFLIEVDTLGNYPQVFSEKEAKLWFNGKEIEHKKILEHRINGFFPIKLYKIYESYVWKREGSSAKEEKKIVSSNENFWILGFLFYFFLLFYFFYNFALLNFRIDEPKTDEQFLKEKNYFLPKILFTNSLYFFIFVFFVLKDDLFYNFAYPSITSMFLFMIFFLLKFYFNIYIRKKVLLIVFSIFILSGAVYGGIMSIFVSELIFPKVILSIKHKIILILFVLICLFGPFIQFIKKQKTQISNEGKLEIK